MNSDQPQAKLLIVDDEPSIRKLLTRIAQEGGHQCTTASNAAQARALLDKQSYDVLLSDIQMPGEPGDAFIHFARDAYPEMAIVIVSVISDPKQADAFLKMGAYGYIVKPFERYQVLITINNALIRRNLEKDAGDRERNLKFAVQQRTSDLAEVVEDLTAAKARVAATARYHKDQALFMQTLLDAIPNPIFYKDVNGVYQGCNHAFELFVGQERGRIVGKTARDLAPADLVARYQREDEKLLGTKKKQVYEGQVRYADGSLHEVLFSKAAYKNSSGETEGIVGVMVDITERKRRERELRMSEEKNKRLLENIGMGIVLVDPRMRVLEMNKMMRQWFPGVPEEGCPLCYESLPNPPRTIPCSGCPVQKTLEDGQVHEAVVQHNQRDGVRSFKIVSSAILDSDGRIAAVIELVSDITEELVLERELRQAQKMASIGQLAAGVAHEINNPTGFVSSNLVTLENYQEDLNQLLGQYRVLKETVGNAGENQCDAGLRDIAKRLDDAENEIDLDFVCQDIGDLIAECREGMDRIRTIVEDLKHFAHPGQDKIQDTDINRELETTLNVVNNELKYKSTIVKEYGDLPIIRANPQQLNQVFVNILVNAAQSISGMGEIRIGTRQVNGCVEVRISDTGCGIAEENLSKFSIPFLPPRRWARERGWA